MLSRKLLRILKKIEPSVKEAKIHEKLNQINTPNIVPLIAQVINADKDPKKSKFIEVMPFMGGGNGNLLAKRIQIYKTEHPEEASQFLFYVLHQILETLVHMHKNNICYLDCNPGNLVFDNTPEKQGTLKLIDFGCSQEGTKLGNIRTDMRRFPPEVTPKNLVLNENFSKDNKFDATKIDVWQALMTVLEIAIGRFPFPEIETRSIQINNWEIDTFQKAIGAIPELKNSSPSSIEGFLKNHLCIYPHPNPKNLKQNYRKSPAELLQILTTQYKSSLDLVVNSYRRNEIFQELLECDAKLEEQNTSSPKPLNKEDYYTSTGYGSAEHTQRNRRETDGPGEYNVSTSEYPKPESPDTLKQIGPHNLSSVSSSKTDGSFYRETANTGSFYKEASSSSDTVEKKTTDPYYYSAPSNNHSPTFHQPGQQRNNPSLTQPLASPYQNAPSFNYNKSI